MPQLKFVYDDGGRSALGMKGKTGDCVVRAIAIAARLPYALVYNEIWEHGHKERLGKRTRKKSHPRTGVHVKRKWFRDYMDRLGWRWVPTMKIGEGCTVHLVANELPRGRLIVSLSRHYTAILDHVIHDTYDPRRGPTYWYDKSGKVERIQPDRCVYGYWVQKVIEENIHVE